MHNEGLYALVLGIFIVFYMLPSIVAFSRTHHNAAAITALNLLLGWTVLGWITALVWSLTHRVYSREGGRP